MVIAQKRPLKSLEKEYILQAPIQPIFRIKRGKPLEKEELLEHQFPVRRKNMEILLKVKDVAKILDIRKQAVLNLIRDKELKAFKIRVTPKGLGDWRIKPKDLREYVNRQYKNGTRRLWDKRCRENKIKKES